MCDGKNTVRGIVKVFDKEYPNTRTQDVEKAVLKYLNNLAARKIVGFAVK